MNLPNKITISRILMIPFFIVLMAVDFGWGTVNFLGTSMPAEHLAGALLFILASITDWIDGYIARKYHLITNFGKFLDPLADKLLVSAALIMLVEIQLAPAWMVIAIICREFAVTGLRLILAETGEVVAANTLGKIKTWTQIIAIAVLLLHNAPFESMNIPFGDFMLWVALFFTLWSGWDYFKLNKDVFKDSK